MGDLYYNPRPLTPHPDLTGALAPFAARITSSRQFLTCLWNLDNDERPGFLISPPPEAPAQNASLSTTPATVTFLLLFIAGWNEFLLPFTLTVTPAVRVLTVRLQEYPVRTGGQYYPI